jgi:hypothetical protein
VTPVHIHLHLVTGMSSSSYFIFTIRKVVKVINLMGERNMTDNDMHSAQNINTSPVTKDK